ncbi:LamG-like jellyroll fold domain-containing protein [Micromonospora sp. SH-82]|uniref:LamG-like jellyroll fold domain-containing protein n=1 Tax=Micromonospora sp. SH-82 TaxID=3132938 RepID=UPI003EBCA520
MPQGAVRPGDEFPFTWLTWFTQRPAWSAAGAFVGLPVQGKGRVGEVDPHVPASATDARTGAGRAPEPAAGTLESYQPHRLAVTPDTTGVAEPGFDARTSKRDLRRSTQRSDVFTNADGSVTRRTYNRPVNYRAADGTWRPIDSDLTRRSDGRLHVTANRLGISVAGAAPATTTSGARAANAAPTGPPAADRPAADPSAAPSAADRAEVSGASDPSTDLARLTLPGGETVGYRLEGATVGTPEVTDGTAVYRNVLTDTDLELTTFDAGIKETLVLRSPQAPSTWVFPLRLTGLTPRLTVDGEVELLDADGKAAAWFPHGSMQDANVDPHSGAPAESSGVTFELITVAGAPALRVVADRAWLDDPSRQYPVRVDPTVTTGTTGDVYVDNDSATTNHNGDNLPVGTYDGGTVKARSFINFDEFDDDGLIGKRITAAKLRLYHTWSYDCSSHKPFQVHRVTQPWTVANLTTGSYPGPTVSASIGSLTITNNSPACGNTAADRSVGRWATVPLEVATFNDWSTGGANEGLALTASETDSTAWKRFTAANYSSGAYKPYLELTYSNNVVPQVNLRYPGNNAVVNTLTPELLSRAVDPDKWPAKGFTYNYVVTDAATNALVVNSGWVATPAWTVPTGLLAWNKTYLYTVRVYDKVGYSAVYPAFAFSTSVPQPVLTTNLAQNSGKGFDPSIGNYTTSATDASVATVGPSLSVTRSYNSLDTRRHNAFGTGWSSMVDTRATRVLDVAGTVQSVLVTYPTGQDVAFGRNANGTFTAPSGRFATLVETKNSAGTVTGYTLTDKDATVYTFGRAVGTDVFKVTRIADANGRALTFTYSTTGQLTTVTSAAGRSLHVTWSTPTGSTHPHVATVTTDPATPGDPTTAAVWQYGYGAGDQLTQVCPPTDPTRCTTYQSTPTSQYANAVLNAGPYSYWRMDEAAGTTTAASRVLSNAGVDNARYTNVTLGQPAGLPGSTATTAGFNGTSSHVQLPGKIVSEGQYQSVSMWFRTTTPNGVLFSYQVDPIGNGTTSSNYTPALYIGSDGRLRGEFWMGSTTPMTTDVPVTDGNWHHVVLAGAGDTQRLYLDGVLKGTLNGTISLHAGESANVLVGAGFVGGGWPGHLRSGTSPAVATHFTGSIGEVAFFNQALTGATAAELHAVGRNSHPVLSKVVRPSGGTTAEIAYDTATGRVASLTDENGGTWNLAAPTVSGNSDVYAASVLGAKPADYWRLGETEVTEAVNEVQGGTATYDTTTLGVAGPFSDSRAASFNGTSSHLVLPPEDIPTTGPNSVEMWFKVPSGPTTGGVLYGYQAAPLEDPSVTGNWTPALYVGTDGKLRGGFWTGSPTRLVTSAAGVNDNKWHHVVLSAGTNTQTLYLDGVPIGTINHALAVTDAVNAYVGAGKWSGSWPMTGTRTVGHFTGSVAEVAFYRSQLSAEQVSGHFAASKQTAPVAVTMLSGVATAIAMPVSTVTVTGPTGETTSYSYDLVNGNRLVAQTDGLGNTTKFGYDVGGYGNLTYDPRGVWSQELQDVRGNTRQVITCQDQSAGRCSSVYYTYYPDATTTVLTPDPRNDLILTVRDGRSASETDDTYRTSYGYDTFGNQVGITDPLGRTTRVTYTDGTTVAAKDGGFAPAGLPATVTTPGGQVQRVFYNASGDVAEVIEPSGKIIRYTYDGVGRVLTETEVTTNHATGLTTGYTYDLLGRPVTETEPGVTNRVTGAVHTARTTTVYDVDGNVTEVTVADLTGGDASRTTRHTYNGYGQESSTTNAGNQTTTFGYDVHGRVVSETEPDGTVNTSTYDAEGNLLTSTVEDFTGDPNNPSSPRDLVTVQRAYDPAGRLASETDAMGWTTAYTYTDNGLEAKVTRTDNDGRTFLIEENRYDAAGNVVTEVTNNGHTVTTATYDAAGRTATSTVDPDGLKRKTTLVYDLDDNVVSTVSTSADGTVTSVSDAFYDHAGRAVAETEYTSTALTPVGRWKLDETTGTKAADAAGNSPATAAGGVTWSTERGGSAVFDGTSGHLAAPRVVDTTRAFTVAAWVKLTGAGTGTEQLVVSAPGATGNTALKLHHLPAQNRWHTAMSVRKADGTVTWVNAGSPNGSATPGTWTHLAVTADPATKTLRLYANGTLQGTTTTTEDFNNQSTGLTIGGADGFGWFPGAVDDVQAYQKALSAAEISQLRAGTAPAADAQVIRTSQTVDSDDLPTSVTDPNGDTTYYGYDEEGRAVRTTAPAALVEQAGQLPAMANAVTLVGYNTFDEPTDVRDANGNWSVIEYDALGRTVAEQAPAYTPPGATAPIVPRTTQTYDAGGEVATVTDPLGRVTRYTYDQLGRLAEEVAPNDGATTYTYDDIGNTLSVTDPTGAVTTATYDYLGRTVTSTDVVRQDSTHHTTHYTYTPQGWPQQVTTPAGVTSRTEYNVLGEPTAVFDGANNRTRYEYDAEGRTTRTIRPDNSYSTVEYDLADRPLRTAEHGATGTLLSDRSARYDRAGNLVASTDAKGTTATFEYDATGVVTRHTQPISGSDAIVTTFGYDLEGNRTRFTDGRGNAFFTTYNPWGLPESQIEPATAAHPGAADRTFTLAYDAAARPVRQLLPGGVSVTNTYGDLDQLLRQAGAGAEAATTDRVFDYDVAGRMTSFSGPGGTNSVTYDDRGQPRSVTGPEGNTSFGYDADGRVTSRQDAAGTTTFGYDVAGRLATLSNPTAGTQLGYTYNTLSQVTRITHGTNGNTRNFTFDASHRIVGDELRTPTGTPLAKITYGWDLNDNIVTKNTTGFAGSANNSYTYDLAGRLTSWNNGTTSTVYAYDKAGNRVQNGAKLFSYDQRNRLLDADGTAYQYTARGTLARAGGNVTSADALGQVVSQEAGGATQTYSYDALGRAVRPGHAYSGLGNDLAADSSSTYVRGPGGDVVGTTSGGQQRMVWTDLHTDVVGQLTATGTTLAGSVTYDPLGKVVVSGGLIGQLGYQSEWTDAATSRVNMHARWYNPDTGQFDTRDTASNSPLPDSINANRYQYGDANPLTVTDPTGHWGLRDLGRGLRKAASAVTSTARSAYSYTSSYVSRASSYAASYTYSAYNSAKAKVTKTVKKAKAVVKKKVQQVKRKYEQVKQQVKKKYNQAKRYVKKKVEKAKKYVAKKVAAVKKKAKQTIAKAKQAGKKIAAKAQRVVKKATTAVRDATNATKKWVKDHKDVLLEVAAIGGAILAGIACTAVTAGAGALACIAGAGALITLAKDAAQGDIHSMGDALGSLGTGAVAGLLGGAGGAIAARVGAAVAKKAGTGLLGRLAVEGVEGGVEDALGQVATTGSYNPRAAVENMVPGLGALSRKGGGGARSGGASPSSGRNAAGISVSGGSGSCPTNGRRHSFDPQTPVLMADGSSRPIEDVNVGDRVLATDPVAGRSEPKQVTRLHRNVDEDLTDLTVRDQDGRVTKVETTWHHPFWNDSKRKWTDAKDLKPGTRLLVRGKGAVTVVAVLNQLGTEEMRDLTVADIHTYYVLAGQTPVLVHNNNCPNGKLSDPLPQGMSKNFVNAYDDIRAGSGVPQTDPSTGVQKVFQGKATHEKRWAGALEYRVPGTKGDNARILAKTLPDGRMVMGWTNDHYKTIKPFTAPHFPDAGW